MHLMILMHIVYLKIKQELMSPHKIVLINSKVIVSFSVFCGVLLLFFVSGGVCVWGGGVCFFFGGRNNHF